MDKHQAELLVREYLNSKWKDIGAIEIMSDMTIEKDYGWVFRYQSKQYLETGQLRDMFIGNCPILINKTGERVLFPTSRPVEESIKRYEEGLPLLAKKTCSRDEK